MAPPAEISIPSTSVSSGPKQHTLYTITLRLPLRSFVVQKRYSQFVDLHQELLAATSGSPPPRPLPPKLWVKNTVSNDEAREERRAGLEAYLRAINENPDRRWRDTPAWRSFLNLPAGTTGSVSNSAASARGLSSNMNVTNVGKPAAATGATDPTTWLDLHREMKNALYEARLHLSKRDDASPTSTAAFEAGTAAKRALVKAGSLLASLTEGLKVIQSEGRGRLGDGELRRRRDLLAAARNERDGLDKLVANLSHMARHSNTSGPTLGAAAGMAAAVGGADRRELLGNAAQTVKTGRRAIGVPLAETERTRELDNNGVLQLQREMMAEQDVSVSDLAKIIRRQKELGLAIHQEIEEQTAMLDQVDNDVTRLEGKTKVVSHRTRTLGR